MDFNLGTAFQNSWLRLWIKIIKTIKGLFSANVHYREELLK